MNHTDTGQNVTKLTKTFNLTCSYNRILHTPIYVNGKNIPDFELFDDEYMFKYIVALCFIFNSIIKILQGKISQIHCINFNDLKPDKGFDTFCNLSNKLGIDKPKNDIFVKVKLGARYRGPLIALPVTLYSHIDDIPIVFKESCKEKLNLNSLDKKDGFSIIITLPYVSDELPDYLKNKQKDFIDITSEIQRNLMVDDQPILILIKKNELLQLKKQSDLWKLTKEYLKKVISMP